MSIRSRLQRLEDTGSGSCSHYEAQLLLAEQIMNRRVGCEGPPPEVEPVRCAECGRAISKLTLEFVDSVLHPPEDGTGD